MFASKAAAVEFDRQMVPELIQIRDTERTVAEQYTIWLRGKGSLKPSTVAFYRQRWDLYVRDRWGNLPLNAIRPPALSAWLGDLSNDVSPPAARMAWSVLHGVLKSAVADRVLLADPGAGISPPRGRKKPVEPLTVAQAGRLLAAAGGTGFRSRCV